ncbi:MAG: amino acid adenylation domain-containing protein [Candidatus Omnitrophota bacterium]
MDLARQLSTLTSEQRQLLELKLARKNLDILTLPISRVETDRERFPLSFQQERLWFIEQMNPTGAAYNIIRATRLEGNLDRQALQQSIDTVIRRHDSCRTVFIQGNEGPVQVIRHQLIVPLDTIDLTHLSTEEQEKEIDRIIEHEHRYVFDLTTGPLLRTQLLALNHRGDDHLFLLTIHHMISDGTSIQIFVRETEQCYHAYSTGTALDLPDLSIQYGDYAYWQRNWFGRRRETGSGFAGKQEAYWLEQFEGMLPVLGLPTDYPRPLVQCFEGQTIDFQLSVEESQTLKAWAIKRNTTLYVLLLSIYAIFLSKLSGMDDIRVGTPVAGRRHPGVRNLIGMFVNTLVMRNYPFPDKTFREFMADVGARTIGAFENQEYQYEDLLDVLEVRRDAGRNPLFDVMFFVRNVDFAEIDIEGLKWTIHDYKHSVSKFDMTLIGGETNTPEGMRLRFSLEYCTKLFRESTILRFIDYFKQTVRSIVDDVEIRIRDIDIMTDEERKRVLIEFNHTRVDYPTDQTLHGLFEDQAKQTPDHIAVIGFSVGAFRETPHLSNSHWAIHESPLQISYRELNEQSNHVAHELTRKGVQPDTIVAIMIERSIEMIITILGILKSGAAYLPIDPDVPQDRIDYMLNDSSASLVFHNETFVGADPRVCPSASFLPATGNRPPATDLAYVIYTSGSTGKPKGVLIEHRSIFNNITWRRNAYQMKPGDRSLQLFSFAFDGFVTSFFTPIISGATVVLLRDSEAKDVIRIKEIIASMTITHFISVPSLYRTILEVSDPNDLSALKIVTLAGEEIQPDLLEKSKKINPFLEIVNEYGPTEGSVVSSCQRNLSSQSVISIGKPIANVMIFIFDNDHHLVPVGIPGELTIAGKGLARGYLNNPELTDERFCLRQPGALFEKTAPGPRKNFWFEKLFGKLYKTGDMGKWSDDGTIEFLGRIDHQVKIRGFRIELGEIENRLLKHEEIRDAVVISKAGENGDPYLCAYVVSGREIPVSELREYLSRYVPDYLIPAYVVYLETMPLTSNGKVDRNALPEPKIKTDGNYVAPRNAMEKKLVKIWSELIGMDEGKIGVHSNFFHLGGHSLKVMVMVSGIYRELNVRISLADVFKNPTIRKLSELIKKSVGSPFTSIREAEKKEYYHLSSAQKRLYILNRVDEQGMGYNIPLVSILEGELDNKKLETAFTRLIHRHESLRTSFHVVNEEPVQRIHDQVEFEIEYHLTEQTEFTENPIKSFLPIFFQKSRFDLANAPLMSVGLLKENNEMHILMVNMHHIISDGMSMNIVINDFMAFYKGEDLPELRIQYKDFSEWQHTNRQKELINRQEDFWLEEFEGEIPVLDLPLDDVRPRVQSFEGRRIAFEIDASLTGRLNALALETGTTLYMVLLALYTICLSKISGQEELIIGTPVAGRRHADLEHVTGMFVNTLALRNVPSGEKRFNDFLQEVKEKTLNAFENQDYPYEELLDRLNLNREAGRNPLFDTMFVLQNMDRVQIEVPGLTLLPYKYENNSSKFDLTLTGVEIDNQLVFTFEYCTGLLKKETVERFIGYFKRVIEHVLKDNYRKVSDIEIISEQEKEKVLFDFNDTRVDYPTDQTIHGLFEDQAKRTPDHLAVIGFSVGAFRETPHLSKSHWAIHESPLQVSYRELNEQSDHMAHELTRKGVQPDTIVAIMIERSIEMIIAILGILKAGAAYLPIDPDVPQDRIDYILNDSGASLVFNNETFVGADPRVCPDALGAHMGAPLQSNPTSNLAYVIYTSGSTGKPKGVLIDHRSIFNNITWRRNAYQMKPGDRSLQLFSFAFDGFVTSFFTPIVSGATVVLLRDNEAKDVIRIKEIIASMTMTHFICVPSLYRTILEISDPNDLSALKIVTLAGEAIQPDLIEKSKKINPFLEIVNEYGPTEGSVVSSCQRNLLSQSVISIGKPIANVMIFIFDNDHHPVPVGIPGELTIAGKGLARGYLNNPELTDERFCLRRPGALFEKAAPGPHKNFWFETLFGKLYKTGDMGKWLDDGTIEFLGRIDHQVKIRGFRIELGEIENRLLKHEEIRDAVVISKAGENGDPYLCAYIVADREIPVSELRDDLSNHLSDYMIPSYFIQIDTIPFTLNGKVNRNALPEPEIKSCDNRIAPRDVIEEKLVALWSEVLGIQKDMIGTDTSFFNLGGHSLKAIALVSKIHKELNVKLPLTDIFKKPAIRQLAAVIKESAPNTHDKYMAVEPAEKKEYYVLSSAQSRLFVLQQMDVQSTAYNILLFLQIKDTLDHEKLEKTFNRLIERHETLRTAFLSINGQSVQVIREPMELRVSYDEEGEERYDDIVKRFVRPFDLGKAPLIRVGVTLLQNKRSILMVDMHHIISDGISQAILEDEFLAFYNGEALPPLRLQYKDYSEWEAGPSQQLALAKQEQYWLSQFNDGVPVLNMPLDFARPNVVRFEGGFLTFEISGDLTSRIKEFIVQKEVTLNIYLMAIYNVLLSKFTGQEDILFGIVISGRPHIDLKTIVGFFVNMLPIRNRPVGNKTFDAFLNDVKENVVAAYENQEYPFEQLVNQLEIKREPGRHPLIDTVFVLQEQRETVPTVSLVEPKDPEHNPYQISHFDLMFHATDLGGTIRVVLEYSSVLFKQQTIDEIFTCYIDIVEQTLANQNIKLSEIEVGHHFKALEFDAVSLEESDFDF